jgi:hypothetical protein
MKISPFIIPPRPSATARPPHDFLIGLDLGQYTDYAAASIIDRMLIPDPHGTPSRTPRGQIIRKYDVLNLTRFPLGTKYTTIVTRIANQLHRFPGVRLIVDATGVGVPVVDMLRDLMIDVVAVTITGGRSWSNPEPGVYHVAKIELVAATRVALETNRIEIREVVDDSGISVSELLRRELTEFKVKTSKAQNEIYSAREGDHYDLVLSTALPIWYTHMMDATGIFITGSSPVPKPTIRNPFKITANVRRLFGSRPPLGGRGDGGGITQS